MEPSALPYEFFISEKLTIDYLNYANNVNHVFPRHFREPSLRKCNIDRETVTSILLEYNKRINAPEQVIQNIESLYKPETYAVITGQQPGLFSGPMYTIYKAVSTIVISERLSTQKYPLVPIFWNASEDHDFSEVNHITMFRENEPYQIHYDHMSKHTALSHISLDKLKLENMLAIIEGISPDSEFKALLLNEIEEIMQKSSNIGDFFSRFMIYLFGELGLVMVEPQHFRTLMIPVFERLIRRPTECTRILNETGSKLKTLGYSPKIHKKPNICNFFLLNNDGKRLRVTYNGKFEAANETFSQKELLELLEDKPFRFSANALTRPITQDFVFPTFAYVAGPNEIAYQAQLKEVYDFFSLEMPVIFPRFGGTIIEKKVSRVLQKHKVSIQELRNPDKLLKDLAREKIEGTFKSFKNEVSKGMSQVILQAKSIDEDLIGSCSLAKGRILKTIEALEDKIASKVKEHNSIVRQQITKAHNNIFPYGHLQERQINIMEYLIKFGKEFLRTIYESFIETNYGEHKVIKC